ncbi:hypothetical protein SAY86_020122 [Trapa natans]|uniref:H/ACA ribonucleoprotein complex non-core subunit NAF1 n=1 Tax=Trapa natans TaxID=22666 RepID=A0AAN7LIJ1_TRANT|nr:hypothetical protein SAY86_020122 [Trapa natans]
MVGFITEPVIQEDEDVSRAPKSNNSNAYPAVIDHQSTDISLLDTFIDFDSIKAWFDHFPDDSGGSEQPGELIMDGVKEGNALIDEFFVNSELMSEDDVGRASALGGVDEFLLKSEPMCDDEVGRASALGGIDEFLVKNEPMIDDEVGRASALRGIDDSKIVSYVGHLKIDSMGDGESRGSCLDGKKSETVVNEVKGGEMGGHDSESENSSESESIDYSSSSSSSSSSSGSSDVDKGDPSSSDHEDGSSSSDGDDDGPNQRIKEIHFAANGAGELEEGEMEEGEIRETNLTKKSVKRVEDNDNETDDGENVDTMVSWSDIEDNDGTGGGGGPIRSKNEVKVLPPVPRVEAKLECNHQMCPVGVVLSVMGAQVIVEGIEKHTPLNEGSILWITEMRTPLGIIDEIFGPVKNPYYVVRYNSEDEVPCGICQGTTVSLVHEFASYIINEKNLYKKGYDASGENDEELSEEAEFSDDEKEAEYRRMQRIAKRGATDPSGMKDVKKNFGKKGREREGNWKNNSNNNSPSQKMWPNANQKMQYSCNPPSSVHPNLMGGTGMISPNIRKNGRERDESWKNSASQEMWPNVNQQIHSSCNSPSSVHPNLMGGTGVISPNFGKKGREMEESWKNNSNNNSSSQQMWPNANQQIQSSCNSPSSLHPNLMGGTGMISPFYPPPQPGVSVPITTNGVWMSGNFPYQQPIDPSLANSFSNMLQWATQSNQFPYQIPIPNPFALPNSSLPNTGQPNALGGLAFAPFSGLQLHNAGSNQMFGMGSCEISSFNAAAQAAQPNGVQIDPSAATLVNSEPPRMFNAAVSSNRGGKPPLNRRGGGRFAGNRGRKRFN